MRYYVCVHSNSALKYYVNNQELFPSTSYKFVCGKKCHLDYPDIIYCYSNNTYSSNNRILRQLSSLMYLLNNPQLIEEDYLFFTTCSTIITKKPDFSCCRNDCVYTKIIDASFLYKVLNKKFGDDYSSIVDSVYKQKDYYIHDISKMYCFIYLYIHKDYFNNFRDFLANNIDFYINIDNKIKILDHFCSYLYFLNTKNPLINISKIDIKHKWVDYSVLEVHR